MASSFKDLRVWQQAIDEATEFFPKHEIYGLAQQMRRAAVSVASNIAVGKGRWSTKEFRHFLFNARGSLLELETQIVIAEKLEYFTGKQLNDASIGDSGRPGLDWAVELACGIGKLARARTPFRAGREPATDSREQFLCLNV